MTGPQQQYQPNFNLKIAQLIPSLAELGPTQLKLVLIIINNFLFNLDAIQYLIKLSPAE